MVSDADGDGVRGYRRERRQFDVVVAGGGPAGFCAAIAAARHGLRTALVTDRPVLGGNSSVEIQVGISGAGHRSWCRNAQETGIIEEFFNRMSHGAQSSGAWRWTNADMTYFDMADREPNVSLILNALVVKAVCDRPGHILHVEAVQQRSEKVLELVADWFIDCTGDGVVGYLAGADFRLGREARGEFGEPSAPEGGDQVTMGATLTFRSVRREKPVPFTAPHSALDVSTLPAFPYFGKMWPRNAKGDFGFIWWAEVGGLINPIDDDEEVSRRCRSLIYGLWDYIKNSGKFENVENQELDWIAPLPGKRESRRLLGPVILTENMLKAQERFSDAIGSAGYMLDVHPEGGYLNPDWGCVYNHVPGICDIPLRSLFSRNIENLFFAGRDISVTHQALGALRVAGTCAVTGQAAAAAVAFCRMARCSPSEAAAPHRVGELQRLLLRHDHSIAGKILREASDLSRPAVATSSSVRRTEILEGEGDTWLSLDKAVGLVLPVVTVKVDFVEVWIEGPAGGIVEAEFFGCDRPENYRLQNHLATSSASVPSSGSGWTRFSCGASPGEGLKLFVIVRPLAGGRVRAATGGMTGAMGVGVVDDGKPFGWETAFKVSPTPCFRVGPEQDLFRASSVNDGHIRPYGLPHLWASAAMADGNPEWIEYDLGTERRIARVELVFNTDLNEDHMGKIRPAPQLVREYAVEVKTGSVWRIIAADAENFLRFRRHDVEPVEATAVRLAIHRTWGSPYAEVFDFRVYGTQE